MSEPALYSEDAFSDAVKAGDPGLAALVTTLFEQSSGATRERVANLVVAHASDATFAALFDELAAIGSVPALAALEAITETARGRRILPIAAEERLFALAATLREFRVLALEHRARRDRAGLPKRVLSLTDWLSDGDATFLLAYARVLGGLREELADGVRATVIAGLRGIASDSALSANERQLSRMALLTWDEEGEETLVTIVRQLASAPHSAQECTDLLREHLARSSESVRDEVRAVSALQWRRTRPWWQRVGRTRVEDLQIYAAAVGFAAGDKGAGGFLLDIVRSRAARRTRALALCELILSAEPEDAEGILGRAIDEEAPVAAWAVSQLYRSHSLWWPDLVARLVEQAPATELRVAASECIVAFREGRVSPAS